MTLRVRLVAAVAYVLLLAIVAFGLPLALSLRTRINDEVRTQAHAQADLVAAAATDFLPDRAQLSLLARTASTTLHGRVLIVNAGGQVLVDSAGPAEVGSNYASRPELARALAGSPDQVQRYSRTLGEEILATAVPIIHNGTTAGAVRVTQSVGAVGRAVARVELELVVIGIIVLLIGLLVGSLLSGQIGRPLRRLEQVARRVAQGDLSARANIEGSVEQRSLAGSFNEMAERISRLLRAQRDFVADASHQLRTPLTGLRLRLEEARALTAADSPAGHELQQAVTEVERLAETVGELLLLSRAGERSVAGTTLELNGVAEAAVARWRVEARARGITLTAGREGAPGEVHVAREDIDRALDALIENALHYSPHGSAVSVVSGPGRIEVRDRGPGISADERELVFKRFGRGSAGRAGPPGHGLGLPIARELARAWGGEVTLGARAGGGTCATVDLRGAAPQLTGAGTATGGGAAGGGAAGGHFAGA